MVRFVGCVTPRRWENPCWAADGLGNAGWSCGFSVSALGAMPSSDIAEEISLLAVPGLPAIADDW
jgi:hypothetical protein